MWDSIVPLSRRKLLQFNEIHIRLPASSFLPPSFLLASPLYPSSFLLPPSFFLPLLLVNPELKAFDRSGSEQQPLDQRVPCWSSTRALNRAFSAGVPPQALGQSIPRRTSTTSSGSECPLPDLKRTLGIKVSPAILIPQPQGILGNMPGKSQKTNDMPHYAT